MNSDSAWRNALTEHREVLGAYVAWAQAVPDAEWTKPLPGRTWSAAEETLHLVRAYELPLSEHGMRLRVSRAYAWVLGNVYLRYLIWRKRFHHGARAPSEVRPSNEEALSIPKAELVARLIRTSESATAALQSAAPNFRMTHAYFGPLEPLMGMRLLNAHTRHHTHSSL